MNLSNLAIFGQFSVLCWSPIFIVVSAKKGHLWLGFFVWVPGFGGLFLDRERQFKKTRRWTKNKIQNKEWVYCASFDKKRQHRKHSNFKKHENKNPNQKQNCKKCFERKSCRENNVLFTSRNQNNKHNPTHKNKTKEKKQCKPNKRRKPQTD